MPSTDRDPAKLVAGDDWHIVGTLLDRAGNPLDLTNASIAWTLLDPSGAPSRSERHHHRDRSAECWHRQYQADRRNDRHTRSRSLHRSAADHTRRQNLYLPGPIDHRYGSQSVCALTACLDLLRITHPLASTVLPEFGIEI